MSQSMFTGSASIPAQAAPIDTVQQGAEHVPPDTGTVAAGQRTRLLAVVAAGIVLVAAAAGYLLTRSQAATSPTTAVPAAHAAGGGPTGSFSASSFPNLPQAFQGVVGRDPFKPLVTPSGTTTNTSATAPVGLSAAPVTPTTPVAGTSTAAATPDWIDLDSQNGASSATFLVHLTNGTVQPLANVAAPARGKSTAFGPGFVLLSLQNGFAVVQFNGGPPFDVLQGYANRHMLG